MDVGLNPRFNKPVWIETLSVRILFSLVKHYVYEYLCLITMKTLYMSISIRLL
jgi:hypothetical protein